MSAALYRIGSLDSTERSCGKVSRATQKKSGIAVKPRCPPEPVGFQCATGDESPTGSVTFVFSGHRKTPTQYG